MQFIPKRIKAELLPAHVLSEFCPPLPIKFDPLCDFHKVFLTPIATHLLTNLFIFVAGRLRRCRQHGLDVGVGILRHVSAARSPIRPR